jgi:hypothetical protein
MREHLTRKTQASLRARIVTVLAVLAFLTLPTALASAQACTPPDDLENLWSLDDHDLEPLFDDIGEARLIEKDVRPLRDSAEGELEIRAHMHGVYEGEISDYLAAIRDIERQAEFLPRLEESEVRCRSGNPVEYARVRQRLAFRFLFFSRDYEYVLHYVIDDRTDEEDGFTTWWVLAEPLDEQILTTDGAWHLRSVHRDGESYVYMGYATHTVFRERSFGLRSALNRFGERDIRRAMQGLHEEATGR